MWRIWLLYDPRRSLVAIATFAFIMVLVNHFVQLSSERYGSWLTEPAYAPAATAQMSALPAAQ
ncbi:MAG: light-harvesting antenna LH1, alpha subunit [Pseudomonadota bacterium]